MLNTTPWSILKGRLNWNFYSSFYFRTNLGSVSHVTLSSKGKKQTIRLVFFCFCMNCSQPRCCSKISFVGKKFQHKIQLFRVQSSLDWQYHKTSYNQFLMRLWHISFIVAENEHTYNYIPRERDRERQQERKGKNATKAKQPTPPSTLYKFGIFHKYNNMESSLVVRTFQFFQKIVPVKTQ